MKNRIQIIIIFIIVCGVVFLFKGARLQLFPSYRMISAKRNLFEKAVKIKPQRGIIYDRYGRELALSVSSFSLFADPSLIKNRTQAADKLSRLLKISRSKILKKIKNKKRRFVWIKRHISQKEKSVVESWGVYGLGFIEEPKRVYPNEGLMSQVLGFTGSGGRGLEGAELTYDHLLKGREQKIITPKDARGRPLFIDAVSFDKSKGSDIYLTIDADFQFVLERELKKAVKQFKASSAVGLILNAQTAEILSLAHFPNFNPNRPLSYNPSLYRNRAAADVFEPGSTFKTFITASALKENMTPGKKYDTKQGKLKIGKHLIEEAESDHLYDELSISEILMVSSNVGSALLALDLTDRVLYSSLKEWGFGEKIGLEFPLEGKGVLQPPPWRDILTSNVGFGQGVSATPLQIASAYLAIAGGGELKKPYLLQAVVGWNGQEKTIKKSQTIKRILTPEQSELLTMMLIQAAGPKGTGSKARIKGFLTAGKTGTAQKPDFKKGGYAPGKYISSFVGFVPANQPEFVIYIAVDEPSTKFYGSTVAAPVFASVGSYILRRTGVSPSLIEESEILSEKKESLPLQKNTNKKITAVEKTPEFRGLSLRRAFQKAKEMDLKLKIKGAGKVRSSIPFPGEPLPKDRQVFVILDSSA